MCSIKRPPAVGKPKYPDGFLAYHKFMFELQLTAPYAGDDQQAYLYKWREQYRNKVLDAKAAKEAEKKELMEISAAKARRDAAGKVPASVSKGPIV